MSGPSGDWHYGRRRHLRLCVEETWGVCPEEPDWQAVPILGDGFGLKAANPRFRPGTLYGGWKRSVQLSHFQVVRGGFVTLPWPQVAALLLDVALDRQDGELPGYCMDYYTPADPRRYLGVKADGLDVVASALGRDAEFRFTLQAAAEEPAPTLAEDDFDYSGLSPVPFLFDGAVVKVDEVEVTGVEQFTLRVRNNLAPGRNRGGAVGFLAAGQRAVSLALRKLDDGDAFNAAVRSGGAFSFEATFAHPEGHTLDLELPVLHAEESVEEAAPARLARAVLRMEAGTDEEGDDILHTVNLAATTTEAESP